MSKIRRRRRRRGATSAGEMTTVKSALRRDLMVASAGEIIDA
jgi:hypothetical protein